MIKRMRRLRGDVGAAAIDIYHHINKKKPQQTPSL